MNRSNLLKLMFLLSVMFLTLGVTGLTGRIAMMNGMSDIDVKWAMTIAVVTMGIIGMSFMIIMFIKINKNIK